MAKFGAKTLPALFKIKCFGAQPVPYEGQINPRGVSDFLKDFATEVR